MSKEPKLHFGVSRLEKEEEKWVIDKEVMFTYPYCRVSYFDPKSWEMKEKYFPKI